MGLNRGIMMLHIWKICCWKNDHNLTVLTTKRDVHTMGIAAWSYLIIIRKGAKK